LGYRDFSNTSVETRIIPSARRLTRYVIARKIDHAPAMAKVLSACNDYLAGGGPSA
jgi:hypothetical protein